MLKCNVCGSEFYATVENHYISRNNSKIGLGAAFSSDDEPILYDTFDCPKCGCQYIAHERKRTYTPYVCGTDEPDVENDVTAVEEA